MKKNKIRQQEFPTKATLSQAKQELQTSLPQFPAEICETAATSLSLSQSLKCQNAISQANTDGIGNSSISQNGGNINCNQLRAGDWVCLLCNNLNFSFRSECNRCLVQTKKKNFFQNMMLVQDGQSSQQQQSDDSHLEIPSSHQEDSQNQIALAGNSSHNDESKLIETPLKYERYAASKAGCGFENVLLLLTPNRNNLHSDDDAEQHRVSAATTAPLSSHSGSDQDQHNEAKHSEKGMLVDSDNNRIQVPFEEDEIFGRDSHCKITSAGVTALQFSSSPAEQKGKCTGVVGEQANKGESLIQENYNSNQGQFQLFGQATQFPHFMSSPSSMHDDDEQEDDNQKETTELRQFDNEESDCSSGSFQNEIQQQINNIIMDEEECKNTGMPYNDDKPDATFRLASNSLNPNDKPSFSFGGSFGRVSAQTLNKINDSGLLLPFSDSQRNIRQSLNFNQACQSVQVNNNSNGGVDFSNYSQYLISNQFNNSLSASLQSKQGSQLAYQATQQSFLGTNLKQQQSQVSEDHFVNSNAIRETQQTSNFQQQSQNYNGQQQFISLAEQLLSNNSQKYQGNLLFKDPQNKEDSLEDNGNNLFDDGSSNTFLPNRNSKNSNVFSKLAQFDNFYSQENLLNQNTINFEQASVFAGKAHQMEEMSPEESDGQIENDNNDEQGEQIHNSGVKSAKKSNNIRKKPKNQTSENKKKTNKLTLSLHQHHQFYNNSVQQPNLLVRVNINPSACSQPIPAIAVKDSGSMSYLGQYQSINQVNSNNQPQNPKKQDWICPRCANLNYSFRKLCNKCQFAKNNFAIHIPHPSQQQLLSQSQQKQQCN